MNLKVSFLYKNIIVLKKIILPNVLINRMSVSAGFEWMGVGMNMVDSADTHATKIEKL